MRASWWTVVLGVALFTDTGCNKASTTGAGGSTGSAGTTSGATTSATGTSTSTSVTASTGTVTYCNPVTGKQCNIAGGSTCDWGDTVMTYICLDPPPANNVALCGTCDPLSDLECSFGTTCIPADAAGDQKCMQFCCTDADCGGAAGSCDMMIVTGIGICGKPDASKMFAVPVCTGIPTPAPSNGACYMVMAGG